MGEVDADISGRESQRAVLPIAFSERFLSGYLMGEDIEPPQPKKVN